MKNPLKDALSRGEKATNTWLSLPGTHAAEFLAAAGFDALTIDM